MDEIRRLQGQHLTALHGRRHRTRYQRDWLGCLALVCLILLPLTAWAERRVALVIGNADYFEQTLRNPLNDARDMRTLLLGHGFRGEDIVYRENLKRDQIGQTLREFKSRLAPDAVAVVFYAGHGLQRNGENYLPSVDARIDGEEDIPQYSIQLSSILDALSQARARVSVVLLDACRNNPYKRASRDATRGLARAPDNAAVGTLIAYATRVNAVAADGSGRNGTFTSALLRHLAEPGVPIEQALKKVVRTVRTESRGAQDPWFEGSIDGDFVLADVSEGPRSSTPVDRAEEVGAAASTTTTPANAQEVARSSTIEAQQRQRDAALLATTIRAANQGVHGLAELQRQADQSNPFAALLASWVYRSGVDGWPRDLAKADQLQSRLAAQRLVERLTALGSAESTNADALALVSVLQIQGSPGLPADPRAAELGLRKAAGAGSPLARTRLGLALLRGEPGFARSPVEARSWMQRAAEAGELQARFNFGGMMIRGIGGPTNVADGLRLWEQAAASGYVPAMVELALILYGGQPGVPANPTESVRWARMATQFNHQRGMVALGWAYRDGRGGITQDLPMAVQLFRRAKDLGDAWGRESLGVMLTKGGANLPPDIDAARAELRVCADQTPNCAFYLGQAFEASSDRVQADIAQARHWYGVAASKGQSLASQAMERLGAR